MDSEAPSGHGEAWPPPHPSPPLPPPREYGSPGTDEQDLRWLWGAVGGLVAIGLFAGVGVWLLGSSGDDAPAAAASPSTSAPAPPAQPEPETPTPVAGSAQPPPQARCWDGSVAPGVESCPMPDGAAGLAWVFPQLAGQRCRPPRQNGPGVVVRVLCSATLADGTKVQLGYYQWASVQDGLDYYDAQGLARTDADGFHDWTTTLGKRTKTAVLYAEAPYSRTLVFRTRSADSPELQHLQPRQPDRLRGEPVG